jgi:hypothetical protein
VIVASVGIRMSLQSTIKSIKMFYGHYYTRNLNIHRSIFYKRNPKMNIKKLLNENLESFYPWSDNENPPLDTNKSFVEKQREIDEVFEGWRASM